VGPDDLGELLGPGAGIDHLPRVQVGALLPRVGRRRDVLLGDRVSDFGEAERADDDRAGPQHDQDAAREVAPELERDLMAPSFGRNPAIIEERTQTVPGPMVRVQGVERPHAAASRSASLSPEVVTCLN
jgi:hypothetical protein